MFPARRSNRVYYLWFHGENGKRHNVSTACKPKSDALKFLQRFRKTGYEKQQNFRQMSLSRSVNDEWDLSVCIS